MPAVKRTLGELAKLVGGQVHGDDGLEIAGAETIRNARPGDITLATDNRLQKELEASDAVAVVDVDRESAVIHFHHVDAFGAICWAWEKVLIPGGAEPTSVVEQKCDLLGPLDDIKFELAPSETDADTSVTFEAVPLDDQGRNRPDPVEYSINSGPGEIDPQTGVYTPDLVGQVTINATANQNGVTKTNTTVLTVTPGKLAEVEFLQPVTVMTTATLDQSSLRALLDLLWDGGGDVRSVSQVSPALRRVRDENSSP
jgi:uncharacterized protein (DUF1810 family)